MVLESTIVCVDNSEYMRNSDFIPSRLHAQQEAVSLVCHAKLRSNPENNVGLLSMAGNPQVLTTLTTDVGRVLSKLHQVQVNGETNLLTGIKVAHLALKHRQGKNHKMRIVAFVGSPVGIDEKELTKMAKKLKKEKVNVDIVNFGEEQENTDKLMAFIRILDGTSSHMVTVPSGSALSDALFTSPVILGEDGSGAAGLGGTGFEFGIDPNEDPELALALRVSLEEQRLRQEEQVRKASTASAAQPAAASTGTTPEGGTTATAGAEAAQSSSTTTTATAGTAKDAKSTGTTEEEMLEKALAMSLQQQQGGPISSSTSSSAAEPVDISRMTEDEQIQYAMQMSLQAAVQESVAAAATTNTGKKDSSTHDEPMDTDDSNDKKP